jgi:hypothetical protein
MRAGLPVGLVRRMSIIALVSVGAVTLIAGLLVLAAPAGRSFAANVSGSTYTSVVPFRITDTRTNSGLPNAGDTLGPGGTITVQVTGTGGDSGVPAGATAAALNVTATNTTASSYLSVYPAGTTQPTIANLNFVAGQTVAGFLMVPLSSDGAVTVYNYAGNADVVVDVDGYYGAVTTTASGTGLYDPVNPFRALGSSSQGASFGAGTVTPVTVSGGTTTVPSTASAVVVNLTAIGNAPSYLTAYPDGASMPLAASLNFGPGQIISNRSVVGVGTNGQIDVYNFAGAANVDVDVDGYYSGGTDGTGSLFVPITPVRVVDTRTVTGGSEIAASTLVPFDFATAASTIPTTATAVAANVTVVPGASAGFVTVFPTSDSDPPLASDVNWAAQSGPVPNFTVADTNGTGSVDVYNFSDATPINLVVDDFGYFVSTSSSTPSAGGGFHAITCPSTSDCVAVGQGTNGAGLVEVSTNGGASFTDEPVPAGLPALFGVSCPDKAHCYAVGGSDFIASTNGGQSWVVQSQSGVDLYTVACESDSVCVSSGFNGSGFSPQSFFYTADGGTTWNLSNSSPGGIATYMTCLSSSCIGVGEGLLQTVDGGETWSLVPSTGQNTLYDTDDCLPTTTTCLAVGTNTGGVQQPTLPGELDISTDGGASWQSSSALPASTASLRLVACGSTTTCLASGFGATSGAALVTVMTTDAGGLWTSVTGPSGFDYSSGNFGAIAMACTTASTCIIVGTGSSGPVSSVTTDDGGSWSPSTVG